MKETMFFATFEAEKTKHDRMQNFKGDKSLEEFGDWLQTEREELERNFDCSISITRINILRNESGANHENGTQEKGLDEI